MGEVISGPEFPTDISNYHVEPLHKMPSLLTQCCELINSEWKRDLESRKRSIESSSENFPMSLLLLLNDSKSPKVVGHCKITRIPFSNNKVFVQSVIIHPKLRGKGFGKFLMEQVEEVVKRKKIKTIYLSTMGKEGFYEKLGFTQCSPISIYGSSSIDEDEFSKFEPTTNNKPMKSLHLKNEPNLRVPPPPPPPPFSNLPIKPKSIPNTKTYMKKEIII